MDGEEYVRVFTVPAAGKPALNFDKDAKAKLGPLPEKDGLKPEGNFYAVYFFLVDFNGCFGCARGASSTASRRIS